MRIHLAVDSLGNKGGGGQTILVDLLRTLIDDDRFSKVTVFCSPRSARGFDLPYSEKLHEVEQPGAGNSYLNRIFWFEKRVSQECSRVGADILLCLNGMGHAHFPIPHVTYVHQSLPFSREAMRQCSLAFQARMSIIKFLTKRSCRSASGIIVQTLTMLDWLSKTFDIDERYFRVFMPPVYPIPYNDALPVTLQCFEEVPFEQRLLYVGSHYPYKNLVTAFRGIKQLRRHFANATLFMIGPPVNGYVAEGVCSLGYLEKADVYTAYRQSALLVQPSLVESAPLPVAEAMLTGTPVLISNRPYAHDMCEDAAEYFDPFDPDDFAQKAASVLRDRNRRDQLGVRGKSIMKQRLQNNSYQEIANFLVEMANSRRQPNR